MSSSIKVGEKVDLEKGIEVNYNQRAEDIEDSREAERKEQKRLKGSPYKNFLQVNKDMYKVEDWLMSKSPTAYRVFKFLMTHMDGYNAVVCSNAVMQEFFGVSRTTISRSIKLLKDKGYIAVVKSGTTNVYTINDKIAWNSWGSNYPYSKFPANVIISISEQEESVQNKVKKIKHNEIDIAEDNS